MSRPRERMEKRLATPKTFLVLRCEAHTILDLHTIARPEGVKCAPVHKGPRMFQKYHDAVPCGLATPIPETPNSLQWLPLRQRMCRSIPLASEAIPPRTRTTGRIDLRRISMGGYNKTLALAHNRLSRYRCTMCIRTSSTPAFALPTCVAKRSEERLRSSHGHSEKHSPYPHLKQSPEKGRISGLKPHPCLSRLVLPSTLCNTQCHPNCVDQRPAGRS